jgi:hypothetical protein
MNKYYPISIVANLLAKLGHMAFKVVPANLFRIFRAVIAVSWVYLYMKPLSF